MHDSRIIYHDRALQDCWLTASEQFPVLFLAGPRQVGKTTLLEHVRESDRTYVSLDDYALRSLAQEDPDLFLQRFPAPVLIDEIQYAPQLLPSIKMRVDADRVPGGFWLTGSQQFPLMKGITESLAGRVAIVNLLGFSQRERDRRRSDLQPFIPLSDVIEERAKTAGTTSLKRVYRDIWTGSFPAIDTGQIKDRDLFYRSYVQTYLERDVRDLIQVGDLETFRRFLRATAARTGQMLNYTDLSRDVGISVNTARKWMSVLVASFQVFVLRPYHTNVTKRLYKTPKLYFLDTGLCAYLTEWSSPETLEAGAMSGALFETYVFGEFIKSWWHRLREPSVFYYRDKDGREIDLLISMDRRLHPVEIKKSARLKRDASRHFAVLENLGEPTDAGAIICLNPRVLPIDSRNTSVPVGIL